MEEGKLNIHEKTKKNGRGKTEHPRKDKEEEKERGKHDQKASNDIADWKWENKRA